MTDRELLELAAKAVDLKLTWNPLINSRSSPIIKYVDAYEYTEWNPLTDDGDALRLAVKLGIQVTGNSNGVGQAIWSADNPCGFSVINEENAGDPYAAVRRAIVRAAAEIERVNGEQA